MTILTRYVLRAHAGPFLFAFSAVTGLLFLNAVAQRLEALTGRGLDVGTIGEFMLLSLPHVIALTFPMSILVAVLYAFSDLTGSNEVAAMAGGGVHPVRLMAPLFVVGVLFSGGMLYFNDQVLPESNHRLNSLLTDITSKSPTFQLREEIVNEIHAGDDTRYFLRARTIDRDANELHDVTIFDLSEPAELRTIVAESGTMAFTPDLRDLHLTLRDGVVYGLADERPGSFQLLSYQTQILPIRGVGAELERRTGASRGDREMSIAMLREEVEASLADMERVGQESRDASMDVVQQALGHDPTRVDASVDPALEDLSVALGPDWQAQLRAAGIDPEFDRVVRDVARLHQTNLIRWDVHRLDSFSKRVEIHKKYAIAMACLLFVLLGPPLAIRFPQGGVGMVIAASVGIFFIYWVGLIGGERLADRGLVDPAIAMWSPSAVLLLPTAFFLSTVARQISTNRGSTWDEIRHRIATLFRRSPPGARAGTPAAGASV